MNTGFPKIGCCGFPFPKDRYAARFPVGEVQQTFYQPPSRISTLEHWRELVPKDFEFTLKAWQLITHTAKSPTYRRLKVKLSTAELNKCGSFRLTQPVLQAWDKTVQCATALEAKLVLFQCPASFGPTPGHLAQMRRFFSRIDRYNLTLLWEPRGAWPMELIRSLCDELKLIHAVDPFVSQTVMPEWTYFRLHGGKGFRHVYTDAELCWLRDQLPKGKRKPAYVMFNNMAMWQDALRFTQILRRDVSEE